MTERHDSIGVVIIGRNEGERLQRCITSVIGSAGLVVYVDSGSTDGSVTTARELHAHVVELDTSQPFTAARGRNAGLAELLRLHPQLTYVQFIDGDCEIVDGWMNAARQFLDEHDEYAVVCGRRRERFPDQSVYNRLIDMEWDTPVGDADACGGDAMMRAAAVRQVGGFDDTLIAGEEPELCLRLRADGWQVHRLDHEMTVHDANVTRFGQWWRRSVRCGHAYAEGRALHGPPPERYRIDEVRSVIEWALILPLVAIGFAPFTYGASLLLLSGYGVLMWRVRRYWLGRGYAARDAHRASVFAVAGKFAELIGIGTFLWNRLWNRHSSLIEYKSVTDDRSNRRPVDDSADSSPVAMETGHS